MFFDNDADLGPFFHFMRIWLQILVRLHKMMRIQIHKTADPRPVFLLIWFRIKINFSGSGLRDQIQIEKYASRQPIKSLKLLNIGKINYFVEFLGLVMIAEGFFLCLPGSESESTLRQKPGSESGSSLT
jgi:hypothetical protein